ncbi:MAG: transporter substrate-binding domain-containing protein [Bacteroidales bacterium]|nr:transporter substrate-binding domain-containing protein [Bacteroidales bacterium]
MKFKPSIHIGIVTVLIVSGLWFCNQPGVKDKQQKVIIQKPRNLVINRILQDGRLVAATDYNSTNYFIYRGEPMGYQYEMLKSFADYLGVKLDLRIINDLEKSFNCIQMGTCELLAIGLTITKDRAEQFSFSEPLSQTRQMLVQRKPKNWRNMQTMEQIDRMVIRNPLDLAGKTIHIQKNSTYKLRLDNLSNEIGADIQIIEHDDATTEELIEMVADDKIEFTVCDEHIALVNKKFYPDLDVKTAISFPQNVAWAVRKGSDGLLDTLNAWLKDFKKSRTSAYMYNKYFRNSRTINIAKSEFSSLQGGKISPYDQTIRQYSSMIDWDWRLLASLIYQESRFYPEAKSWAGAFGLMQLMPHTAEKYGVDSLSPPEDQIKAGVEFIRLLDKQFVDKIEDKDERTKFVLASYNAGIAHVYDARRLAEKYNKDPNKWDENVDYYLLNKSKPEYYNDSVVKYGYCRGTEPYNFVYDILDRFHHYKNVIND